MHTSPQNQTKAAGEKIAGVAYTLWERAGRPSGRDEEFWLEAERQIAAAREPSVARSQTSRSAAQPATESKPEGWSPVVLGKGNAGNPSRAAARQTESRQR